MTNFSDNVLNDLPEGAYVDSSVRIISSITGQQFICNFKTHEVNGEVVGCTVINPKLLIYKQGEEGQLMASFSDFCPLSPTTEFKFNLDHVSAVLEAYDDVVEKYLEVLNPKPISMPEIIADEEDEDEPIQLAA